CYIVVVQYDGRELRPTGKNDNLEITWNDLENTAGNGIGSCAPSISKLTAECTINDAADATLVKDLLVITSVGLADGKSSGTTSEKTKLKFKIGVVAGLVPSIPVQYTSDTSIFDVVPSSLYLASGVTADAGFQPISHALDTQIVINDRGIGFINSACIREKKIYFSSGLNVFWIEDWTAANAEIKVYSGANSTDRILAGGDTAEHRLWVTYKGNQTVYCAPKGVVVVDQSQGTIIRLWDSGKAQHIAGKAVTEGNTCLKEDDSRPGVLSSSSASSKTAKNSNLACIGGLDIDPETENIYFSHADTRIGDSSVYKLDYSKDKIEFIMTINSEFLDNVGPFDDGIFKGSQNAFRTRNRMRSPALKLNKYGKFYISDFYHIIEGNLATKKWTYKSKATQVAGSPQSAFGMTRGFYTQGNDLFLGTEVGIQRYDGSQSGSNLSRNYIGSQETAKSIRNSTDHRYLGITTHISKINLHAVQSVEKNKHEDYDDVIIAEWDAIRVMAKSGNVKTVIQRANIPVADSCAGSLQADEVLMPFISDLTLDKNSKVYIASSGVASPGVDDDEGGENSDDYVTYFDFMMLAPGGDSSKVNSHKKCFDGLVQIDNSVVNKLNREGKDNPSSTTDADGIALRQDWYPAFIGDDLYMASGDRVYKKTNLVGGTSAVEKLTIAPIAAHGAFLDEILDQSSPLTQADFPNSADLLAVGLAFQSGNMDGVDDKLQDFFIETPVIASANKDGKLYLMTGLIGLSGTVLKMVQGGEEITKLLTGSGSVAEIIGQIPTGYKIVEVDVSAVSGTKESKIIFHSFPGKTSIDKIDFNVTVPIVASFTQEIRDADVWTDAWQLGRGGLDIVKNSATDFDFYVTAPYMFRVDTFNIDPTTHTFDMGAPNVTSSTIAGKAITPGQPVVKEFPNDVAAIGSVLWNPWDLSVSDNGDIFVAEALGGGVKRIHHEGGGVWNVSTVFGGNETSRNCMAGEIEKTVNNSATSLDSVINQSSSMLCKGDVWAVEAVDNCAPGPTGNMKIYISQNFMTASNVIELIRPCE
ncbi:hypothetical protein N9W79_01085, partial [bacterium]|nr:hypothetical protein [bacterium]